MQVRRHVQFRDFLEHLLSIACSALRGFQLAVVAGFRAARTTIGLLEVVRVLPVVLACRSLGVEHCSLFLDGGREDGSWAILLVRLHLRLLVSTICFLLRLFLEL